MGDPGDDRLSRQGHYHGPGGLNGRVRDGNGCGPAGMVAGKAAGGPCGPRRSRCQSAASSRLERSLRMVGLREASASGPHGMGSGSGWVMRGGRGPPRPSGPPWRGAAVGSGWSSRSAVRTGRLRSSRTVHARPIDLVISQEPSVAARHGNLVLEGASRLDAFSAYPVPTWLPGDAPSGTAGTPEVGPPQSSRTRGDAPQVSCARGR